MATSTITGAQGSRKSNTEFVPDRRLADHLGSSSSDPAALVDSHLLSSSQLERAALFAKDDFSTLGNTKSSPISLSPDQVTELYDILLAHQRKGDPTAATSGGAPGTIEFEGKSWSVDDANSDNLRAKSGDGTYLLLGQTATMLVVAQTAVGANPESATLAIQSFQSALTGLPLGNAL